jgi:hypothetical protein
MLLKYKCTFEAQTKSFACKKNYDSYIPLAQMFYEQNKKFDWQTSEKKVLKPS